MQEYTEYTRGASGKVLMPVSLTSAERQAEEDYSASTADIVAVSARWAELKRATSRSSEQEMELQELSARVKSASRSLNDNYVRLFKLFSSATIANSQGDKVKEHAAQLGQLISGMSGTVALYAIVTPERYDVLVITPATMVARASPISEKDLNGKIAAFQAPRSRAPTP